MEGLIFGILQYIGKVVKESGIAGSWQTES